MNCGVQCLLIWQLIYKKGQRVIFSPKQIPCLPFLNKLRHQTLFQNPWGMAGFRGQSDLFSSLRRWENSSSLCPLAISSKKWSSLFVYWWVHLLTEARDQCWVPSLSSCTPFLVYIHEAVFTNHFPPYSSKQGLLLNLELMDLLSLIS